MLPNAVIDDHRQLGIELLRRAQHAEAVAFGRRRSDRTTAGLLAMQRGFGFGLIARLDDGVALRFERVAQHRAQRVLVLDEQDRRIGERGGTAMLTAASRAERPRGALLLESRRCAFLSLAMACLRRSSFASTFSRSAR